MREVRSKTFEVGPAREKRSANTSSYFWLVTLSLHCSDLCSHTHIFLESSFVVQPRSSFGGFTSRLSSDSQSGCWVDDIDRIQYTIR